MPKGFTLIEVVAALVMITIGLLTVFETFIMGNKIIALRKDNTAVVYLLQRIMEEAKSKGFTTNIDASGACATFPECTDICVQLKDCAFTVTKQDYDTPALQLKRIDVTVNWSSPGWGPRAEAIATLITNR